MALSKNATFLHYRDYMDYHSDRFHDFSLMAFDGGRLLFLFVEAVRRRRVPPEKEGMVHFAGFALLMTFMVVILFNDIIKLF